MTILIEILQALQLGKATADGAEEVAKRVSTWVRRWSEGRRWRELTELFDELGGLSDRAVRNLISKHVGKQCSREELESVTSVVLNLVQRVRFLNTWGRPTSSFLRVSSLIHQLTTDFTPVRKLGDKVDRGSDWTVDCYLGSGAFGEVWRAKNKNFPRYRAYKFFTDERAKHWVQSEADNLGQVLTRLNEHPNVVDYIDVNIVAGNPPYIGFEYVAGGSLQDWILEHDADRAEIDVQEVFRDIVQGVSEAHRHGIHHRDLKPANVLLTDGPDVRAKIADFGLSSYASTGGDLSQSRSSASGTVGTPMYLPPESADPLAPRDPAQDDVFALGVIWYQLEVGQLERPSYDFPEVLRHHGADRHTVSLISRCLARPSRRFRSAPELSEAMADVSLPHWRPTDGCYDVSGLVRDYLVGRR